MDETDDTELWDGLAERYPAIVRLFDRSYPAIRERLRQDLRGRERVLEVAAGTGQFTLDLAAAADFVLATDLSPKMVAQLQATLAQREVTNVEVAVHSAYALALDDASFDAVFCANALHVMDAPERALAEFARVLGDEGLLVIPTFLHGATWLSRGVSRALSVVSSFVAHTRFDRASLCALIEGGGFRVMRAEQLPGVLPIGYVVAKRQ